MTAVIAQLPAHLGTLYSFHFLKRRGQRFLFAQDDMGRTAMNPTIRFAIWTASLVRETWPRMPPQFRARNCILGEEFVEETHTMHSHLSSPEGVTRPLRWND